jgi:FtsZ-interacting cell division protein ZipA
MDLNKIYIAIIIIILLICIYFYIVRGKKQVRKKSKKPKVKRKKVIKKEEESDEEQAIEDDAEELYNLVHEKLCQGMQKDEFDSVAGNLADPMTFIKLKQIYNQHIDKNMDPMKHINSSHYLEVLKSSDDTEEI